MFKGLFLICLSIGLTSEPFNDLYPADSSCPVLWTTSNMGVGSLRISTDGSYVVAGYSLGATNLNGNDAVSMFAGNSSRPLWNYTTGINEDVSQTPSAVSISDDGSYVSTGGNVLEIGTSVAILGRSQSVPFWTFKPAFDAVGYTMYGPPYVTSVVSGNGEFVAVHAILPSSPPSIVKGFIGLFRRSDARLLWSYNTTDYRYPTDLAPISLSYEGAYLATIDPLTHVLYMFSQHDNQTLWTREGSWNTLMISGTGDYVATGNNTSVNIFGKDSNATLLSISGVYLADFSRDGSTIAVIGGPVGNQTLQLYDRATGKELFSRNQVGLYHQASISRDGSETAVASPFGGLIVYNRSGGLICSAQQGRGASTFVAISGDGRFVVTGNSQLTYMAVVAPNQTPNILPILAGVAIAAAAGLLIFLTVRKRWKRIEVDANSENPLQKPTSLST
jgi:hypothetical protein